MDEFTTNEQENLEGLPPPMPEEEAAVEVTVAVSMDTIGAQVQKKFEDRASKRANKENQWMEARRAYLGSAANYADLKDKPFEKPAERAKKRRFNIVRTQCNTAVSVLWAKQFAGGDKNWDIQPTPHPELSPEMPMTWQEASMAAEAMETVIDDQLQKARYAYNCRLAMEDMVVEGTAIIKSPVNATETKTGYQLANPMTGEYIPYVKVLARPMARRVNPWFWFPDETSTDVTKCRDSIELHPMSREELERLKQDPSFFAEAIDRVLESSPKEDAGDNHYRFAFITDGTSDAYKNKYKVLEYHGPFNTDELGILGLIPGYTSPTSIFYGEVWVVDGKVIRAELSNIEGCQHIPYAVSTWEKDPGSIFGIGLATQLLDSQEVINTTYHMILDNSAISSGPQVVLDKTKIKPADGTWTLRPDKIWFNTEFDTDVKQAMSFYMPPNVTGDLMNLLNTVRQFAQEEGAVPFIMPGTQSAQAADTAFGTKQIMDASTTVIDYYNEKWDDNVTTPVIKGFYAWNMQYNPDPRIKGDFDIDVRSSSDLRSSQIYISELEKLSVEATQNPALQAEIDMAELTKARLQCMRIPFKNIIKTEEQKQRDAEAAAQQGPSPEEQKIQIEAQLAAVKEREVALKEQELQFRMQVEMQKAAWDHEEKMAAQYARMREAEAQVLAKDTELQVEYARLAQTDEANRSKIMLELTKMREANATQRYLKGIEATSKFKDQALKEEEIKLKKQGKTGI